MTKDNADSATNDLRPVADFENREFSGQVLSNKRLRDSDQKKIAALREQQEAYEASLPKDKAEAFNQISQELLELRDITEPQYAVRAALTIIQELSMKGGLDENEQMNEAVFWLTSQGLEGLCAIEKSTRRAKAIARQFHPMHEPYQA